MNNSKISDNIQIDRIKLLNELEKKLKIKFKNINLLNQALTHKSYANDNVNKKIKHNERLEFLGDSIIGFIISEYLFEKFQNKNEGALTKIKSYIVSKKNMAEISKKINLGKYVLLGKGEIISGGRTRISLLEDVMESLIAAYYIDRGMDLTKKLVKFLFKYEISKSMSKQSRKEYKTLLQEYFQKKYKKTPTYKIIKETGPEHNKIFYCEIEVKKTKIIGKGHSKKDAENNCAEKVIKKLNLIKKIKKAERNGAH